MGGKAPRRPGERISKDVYASPFLTYCDDGQLMMIERDGGGWYPEEPKLDGKTAQEWRREARLLQGVIGGFREILKGLHILSSKRKIGVCPRPCPNGVPCNECEHYDEMLEQARKDGDI